MIETERQAGAQNDESAAEVVGEPARETGADHCAQQRDRGEEALAVLGQMEGVGDEQEGARDDAGIVAEQQAPQSADPHDDRKLHDASPLQEDEALRCAQGDGVPRPCPVGFRQRRGDEGAGDPDPIVEAFERSEDAPSGKYRKIKVELVNPATNEPLAMKDEKTGKPMKYQILAKAGYKAPREVE